MEQNTIDIANGCRRTAAMLEEAAQEAGFDIGAPGYFHDVLLRLYYAVGLDEKMTALSAQLGEDTPQDTVDAVLDASAAVDAAADKIFTQLEEYVRDDSTLAAEIDALTLGEKADDIDDLLKKLYKCEGIIRMAYRVSPRVPIYGMTLTDESWPLTPEGETPDEDDVMPQPPEDLIENRFGVDIDALFKVRTELAVQIGSKLKEDGA